MNPKEVIASRIHGWMDPFNFSHDSDDIDLRYFYLLFFSSGGSLG